MLARRLRPGGPAGADAARRLGRRAVDVVGERAARHPRSLLVARYCQQLLDAGWFESDDDPLIGLYERRLFYSQRVEDVDRFVAGQDLATGFRVHGNLPALAHGVPALFVDYDTRSRELADTFHIPP